MSGLDLLGFKVNFFVDTQAVLKAAERGKRKALGHFGGFVRKAAQYSIRRRKAISQPGQPPSSHTGVLKRFLFYAYDGRYDSVLIGPMLTNQKFAQRGVSGLQRGTVPAALEYGGEVGIWEEELTPGHWFRVDLRTRWRANGRRKRLRWAKIARRPYMQPAFEAGKAKLPAVWADCIE